MFKVAECNTIDGGKTFTEGSVVQVKAMLCTFYAIYALHCSYNKFQIQVGTLECIIDVPLPLLISFSIFFHPGHSYSNPPPLIDYWE